VDRRVGADHAQKDRFIPGVARFLEEFTAGRTRRGVPRVEHPSGNLQGKLFRPKTKLFNQDDLSVGGQRDDVDPVGGIEEVKVMGLAGPGRTAVLMFQGEYGTSMQYLRME
jgi:hypothetical protein